MPTVGDCDYSLPLVVIIAGSTCCWCEPGVARANYISLYPSTLCPRSLTSVYYLSGFLFFHFPENVRRLVSESYMLLKSKIPSTLQIMSLYLANKDTEYILFKPVKVRIELLFVKLEI